MQEKLISARSGLVLRCASDGNAYLEIWTIGTGPGHRGPTEPAIFELGYGARLRLARRRCGPAVLRLL